MASSAISSSGKLHLLKHKLSAHSLKELCELTKADMLMLLGDILNLSIMCVSTVVYVHHMGSVTHRGEQRASDALATGVLSGW